MGIDIPIVSRYWCVVFGERQESADNAHHRVAQLEAENTRLRELAEASENEQKALRAKLAASQQSLASLRLAYTAALEQLQLANRRLFVAKAERHEAIPEQLKLDSLLLRVAELETELAQAEKVAEEASAKSEGNFSADAGEQASDPANLRKKARSDSPKTSPTGRRNLAESDLPLVRVEITDPILEATAERIGFEDTWKLGHERGGRRRIQIARVVYKVSTEELSTKIVTAPAPKELFRRSLLAPALIAHILVAKYVLGVPFARQESLYRLQGEGLDRGTMCRYAEDAGATLGAIVEVSRKHAMETAFCLSTDATGVAIQPTPLPDGSRQPCRKGHFFVILADQDYVFFEYQPKHTSAAVSEMFRGFKGYIQADANAVYDALFRGRASPTLWDEPDDPPPKEVGCWSHCRRNFWDAAVCKHPEGQRGLRMIDELFAADRPLWKLPPAKRQALRQEKLVPILDAFFTWARHESETPRARGLVTKALGYALRQEGPLRRFLDDPRLRLENNASERNLRPVTVGRKNWLFFGSDDHAEAAANIFSLVATCKLHGLDPESYLTDVIRVMPYWPRDRYLELSPRFWAQTRSRLNPKELELPVGHITLPPPAE
jgi:transposase